ncbi:hypothetical protein CFC21_050817 [Triticum aestivum]|uniref:Uncharacterized protein n=2 Tax=Triticum aestivum TaxID=4565 RepID=A0A3B6HMG8_WHEAT|nr:hypothetical protein CFC21_050817 [Triticum aestivum]
MEITSSTMVKPAYAVPHPLTGDKVSLTVFDRAAVDTFVPTVLAYRAPAPSNDALREGLLKAVAAYPHLAGRFALDDQGRRFLDVNNEGVLLIEAAVPVDLADVLVAAYTFFFFAYAGEHWGGAAAVQIQLNRYRCGGLVVGICSHHQAADGHSMSMFFTAWASAVRERKDFTTPAPFLDRARTTVPRSTPTPVFDHRSREFTCGDGDTYAVVPMDRIKNLTVHFTAEFVADLKARVGARCSRFQCLLAHVWKKITAARDLKPEEFTKVRVAVRDVLNSSYGSVVGVIRDAVARIDDEYVQSFVDFG